MQWLTMSSGSGDARKHSPALKTSYVLFRVKAASASASRNSNKATATTQQQQQNRQCISYTSVKNFSVMLTTETEGSLV